MEENSGQRIVSHKELARLLVLREGVHEGLWGLFVRFGIRATNVPAQLPDSSQIGLFPAAILPILEIGIQPFAELNDLCVDAAEVNPAPKSKKGTKKATSKAKKK